ncbi:hypothetical protein J6590_034439 [Homalodisca vitripennis]|nr:hypothetical protein J6590_057410 [Homalodisca vitripennis]KAG8317067.1 hypothetical protein J6590_034439 [Homalodisca vitripennis]
MFNANTASPCKLQRGQRRNGTPLPPLLLPRQHRAEIKEMAQPLLLGPAVPPGQHGPGGVNTLKFKQLILEVSIPSPVMACAESLWLEDICEWTIGVLVERSALEALRLDTSIKFVDLATTVLHGWS